MKRHARKAYTAIKNLNTETVSNVHLINHGDLDNQWGAHFLIGAESRTGHDIPVGDYYREYIREYVDNVGKIQNAFGIRTVIHDILDANNLYAEWIDAGTIGVYDA